MDEENTEVMEPKKSFKDTKVWIWCKEHSGEIITIFGGLCTVAGAIINFASRKYEEDEYIYTQASSGETYRLKAKHMTSAYLDIDPDDD